MLTEWVKLAVEKGGGNQAEIARRLSERLGRDIDRSIVQKTAAGNRALGAEEMIALSEISGLPIPGGALPPTHAGATIDQATILRLMREAFLASGRPPGQSAFLAAAIVTVASSPSEIQSLQTSEDYSARFRSLVDQARKAAP